MLPIGDDSSRGDGRGPAIASLTFFVLLLIVFALQLLMLPGKIYVPANLSFIPGVLFGGVPPPSGLVFPPPATLVTYQFLHGGWFHLVGNLLFLWVFGPKVEWTLGSGSWTTLLLLSGIAAALTQAWPDPSSPIAVIGASGGVSGILGAYLYLHPRAEIRTVVPVVVVLRVVELPAWVFLVVWFVVQLLYTSLTDAASGGIAFRAHVGGFVCGLLLAPVLHYVALLSADARPVARTRRSRDSSH
ncbi:MAG: rhomboid family intramembrane serine protease [Gammaproteobacteria bacterium]|nr:rhomboid family intramembrane serine protease [Gammaproteobacteria bacterium]